jgi:L-malate glycosyltransferase
MSNPHPQLTVLHVSTAQTWRGGEQQLAYLVSELRNKGVKQYVLCSQDSAMAEWCLQEQVPFYTARKRSSFDIFFAKRISGICKSNKIGLVHAHDSHAHSFAVYAAAIFGNKSRVIVSRRVDFPVSGNPLSRFKYNHSSVARILCVSDKIRQITEASVKDKSLLVTVHSGVDVSRFVGRKSSGILHREFDLPDSCKLVVNVSALAPHKDLSTFVHVAETLLARDSSYRFLLIGEGGERTMLEQLIEAKGLGGKVILTGFRNDIPDVLPEAGAMLMTSETEGLGTTILDAFACGVPVVATAAGGIPELVLHEQTGLLADVRDHKGLAAEVERLFTDDRLRKDVIDGAAEHLKKFSKAATAEATMVEYLAVAGSQL